MVKNLFELLSIRQNSILSGAVVLMVTVAASKILGLVRDRLLAHNFSPDAVAVFLAAFRIPDLMFQLLIFGAVSVAFIPVFTEYLHKKSEREAFEFGSGILNLVLIVFSLVSILVFFLADPLTRLVVPGFSFAEQQQTASLTRIIMLGQILLAVGAFYAGIAQAYQRFIIPALAALFYNLGIILGIIFLTPILGINGAAFGVVLGAAMHALVQLPLVSKLGFRHSLKINLKDAGLKEVSSMMSMRTVGVAVEQINETVGILLASLISASSVTYLTFATHLHTVPIGLFGATLAQAALPVLSQERSRGEMQLFKGTLLTTMHQILFLTLPAAAILIVLRVPAVRLVFGASQFDWPSTVLTGRTVAFLAAGLTAQAVVLLLMRGFYALKDTRTPVIVSVVSVTLNVILSYVFVRVLGWEVWSLGLSYAIVSNISLVMLVQLLGNKLGGFSFKELWEPFLKMLFAALVAAVALYVPIKAFDQLVFDTTKTINLMLLTGIAGSFGLGVYLLLVWLLQVKEIHTFGGIIKRFASMQSKLKSQEMIKETGAL
ncbi:murein biosynthesis integral membrane protein MurJ [Candidatus Daviesbacteria bacterium RIFCSPHIGHO2_02_FULL_41_14]|uniref:Probable lipid II flippase MurJ n=1 Tax=Candidatus Daviesbacteria bacterium RIFCSPLOWO2_01_FULL_40_24 TaxID=1797787 RepID=A0A1F5MK09_9BACT|nr:MAG: murein biosynthesis integral membrane protein MurJ [Candidatus Daviesbacteria bacterium RIFCSPHIGHO2_01_FULL_41_45]OGE34365.1 MAG: murein biosynthesis integral membrane protein MurJ [Candidatus Daviesbacteria bacterium RIFCSPHIGHO2_02_FULL_41_14]OGE65683.1 MAG: murein biosynthesis integral membrane protein MurJ [Candidatus Daviesbacteria bacterium RIFCSPLOWO2_01_FULL_40_24]